MAGASDTRPTSGLLDSGYTPRKNGVKRPAPSSSPSRLRYSSASGKTKQECIVILDSVSPEPHDHSIVGNHGGRSFSSQTAALTAGQYIEISSSSETEEIQQAARNRTANRDRSSSDSSLPSLSSRKKAKLESSPNAKPAVNSSPSPRPVTPLRQVPTDLSYATVVKSPLLIAVESTTLPPTIDAVITPLELKPSQGALSTLSRVSSLVVPETPVEVLSLADGVLVAPAVEFEGAIQPHLAELSTAPEPEKEPATGSDGAQDVPQLDYSRIGDMTNSADSDFELEPALSADDIDADWKENIQDAGAPEKPRSPRTSPSKKRKVQGASEIPSIRTDASTSTRRAKPSSKRRDDTPAKTRKPVSRQAATKSTKPEPEVLQSQQLQPAAEANDSSVLHGDSMRTESGDESSPVEVTSVWIRSPAMRNKQDSQLDLPIDADGRILSPIDSDDETTNSRGSYVSQAQQRILDRPHTALPTSPWRNRASRRITKPKSSRSQLAEPSSRKRSDSSALGSSMINGTRRSNRTDAKARHDSTETNYDDPDPLNAPVRRRSDARKAKAEKEEADNQDPASDASLDEEIAAVAAAAQVKAPVETGDLSGLDPRERIARMRAQMAAEAGLEIDNDDGDVDAGILSDDDIPFKRRAANLADHDDDDDDLADASTLIKAVVAAKAKSPPSMDAKSLPKDKALEALTRKREREEKRGWYGAHEAERTFSSSKIKPPDSGTAIETGYSSGDGAEHGTSRVEDGDTTKLLSEDMLQQAAGAFTTDEEKKAFLTLQREQKRMNEEAKRKDEIAAMRAPTPWLTAEERPLRIKPFVPYEVAVAIGFDKTLREAIHSGLADSASFPIELFSLASHMPTLTLHECTPSMHNLFELIAHPLTHPVLANRALFAFSTLWKAALSRKETADFPFVATMDDVVKAFISLGLKRTAIPAPLLETVDTESVSFSDSASKAFTAEDRLAASLRLMEIGRLICAESTAEIAAFVDLCLRLAFDPSQAVLRRTCLASLRSTLDDRLAHDDVEAIYDVVRNRLRSCKRQEQAVSVNFIGLLTQAARQLSRTVAYSLLFDSDASFTTARKHTDSLKRVSRKLLQPSSPFIVLQPVNDDVGLYWSTSMLGAMLSNSFSQYFDGPSRSSDRTVRRKAVDDGTALVDQLKRAESRMPLNVSSDDTTRAKAKNALTRITHGLEYRLQMYDKRLPRSEREDELAKGDAAGLGQSDISSFFAKKTTASKVSTIADESMQ